MTRGKGKGKQREVIDLSELDDSIDVPDDDIMILSTPPVHMKKWSNSTKPIDVDADEAGVLQRFTPEENELRRMLMMDHDLMEVDRKKRKGRDMAEEAEDSRRKKTPAPVEPLAGPSTTEDAPPATDSQPSTIDTLVVQILAIFPDMCPVYATKEFEALIAAGQAVKAVETILTKALESGYPKPTKQQAEPGAAEEYLGKVFRADKRRGEWYQMKSIGALEEAFPAMPVGFIRETHNRASFLFGPTYLLLLEAELAPVKAYTALKRARLPAKGKTAMPEMDAGGIEFELEKNWILAHVATKRATDDARAAKELADQEELDAGNGIECGCCFEEDLPSNMFQCPDGHLFCKDCCTRHAEIKLGDEVHIILCMDTSGCQSRFTERELARLLPAKSLELLQRLRLADELEQAEIEGLETCPSCPWAVVIDNPDEKLFRCGACEKVSCRKCRKQEHLPKSCQEFAAEVKADKRHAIEDAMSEALIRKCPKCQKPYIKDFGCNKIRCVKCQALSCYICQKLVAGYDHFDQTGRAGDGKCVLWDHQEAQHDVENVIRARDAAVLLQRERAAQEGIDINAADLAVEAPAATARPGHPHAMFHHGHAHLPRVGPYARHNLLNVPPHLLPNVHWQLDRLDAFNLDRLNPGVPPVPQRALQEEGRRNQLYMERLREVREQENAGYQRVQEERRARRVAFALEAELMDVDPPGPGVGL